MDGLTSTESIHIHFHLIQSRGVLKVFLNRIGCKKALFIFICVCQTLTLLLSNHDDIHVSIPHVMATKELDIIVQNTLSSRAHVDAVVTKAGSKLDFMSDVRRTSSSQSTLRWFVRHLSTAFKLDCQLR